MENDKNHLTSIFDVCHGKGLTHVFPYGSRVYGTFEATSDHDYIGIVQSDVDATEEPLRVSEGVVSSSHKTM